MQPSFDNDVLVEHKLAYSRAAAAARQLRLRAFRLAPVPDAAFCSILLGTTGGAASNDQCKLDEASNRDIVVDGINIEREFVCDAFLVAHVSMNGALMSHYIEFITDRLLMALWV